MKGKGASESITDEERGEVEADLLAAGARPEAIDAFLPPEEDEDHERDLYPVWPENWPVVEAFLRVRRQWVIGPRGGFLCLRYEGVEAALRMLGIKNKAKIFHGLQLMEGGALEVLNRE